MITLYILGRALAALLLAAFYVIVGIVAGGVLVGMFGAALLWRTLVWIRDAYRWWARTRAAA